MSTTAQQTLPEKWVEKGDMKDVGSDVNIAESGNETGHLQELEVDIAVILKEDGEEDIEGDQSPYPEGKNQHI
jgi:hypothetical protein